jgi:hypothetical protein
VDGAQVAANWQDLIDGKLTSSISIDENGNLHPSSPSGVWTGTTTTGDSTGTTCTNWTNNDAGNTGDIGLDTETSGEWTLYIQDESCSDPLALYCFEQ